MTTDFLLNGFSIIGNPQMNTSANQGGQLKIHGGDAVFGSDDIVVLHVTNVGTDGTLDANSVITGITVYDNASDYFNDIPLYSYSGSAAIEEGRAGMGDRYLNVDASNLTSTDSGAPVLGDLAMVAGVDVLSALDGSSGPLNISTSEDIDLNGDGIIDPSEQGGGSFGVDINIITEEIINNVCFARGTLIETPDGPRFIETLREGDLVNTLDNGPQPIRWIGKQTVAGTGKAAPVEIAAGALGNIRQLVVSQNHRMLVAGASAELLFGQSQVLVAAKHLVNGSTITLQPRPEIQYFHFLCDGHQIVFAEGCPAESLYPGAQTLEILGPAARREILLRFPDLAEPQPQHPLSRYALSGREARALTRVA